MDFVTYSFSFESISSSVLTQRGLTHLLLELAVFGSLLLSILTFNHWRTSSKRRRLPRPPLVEGSIPVLGHWWQMSRDPVAFLRAARKRHGPIFQVNIFMKKVVYICDREMQEEFYNADDTQLSLSGVLDNMKIHHIFMNQLPQYWSTINLVVRRAIASSFPKYTPIIKEGAETAVRLLDKTRDLEAELIRYVTTTPVRCLFNVSSTEPLYKDFMQFQHLFNLMIFSTYVLPSWLLNGTMRFVVRHFVDARRMGVQFLPEIRKYFDDPAYDTSLLCRYLADQEFTNKNGTTGKLSMEDVKNLLLLFVHKNSENTINFLRNVVIDLAENPEWAARVRGECSSFVDGFEIKDSKALLQSKLLHACCMESARLNANVEVSRRKVLPHSTIGGYFIGHCHEVVPCATFFMVESDYHKNSLQYNPDRYLADNEQYTPKYITTWGSGVHQCPGKLLAINVVKMFVALVVTNYNIELETKERKDAPSYSTLSPFVIRTIDARLTTVNNNN